jgi:hypothetical protein
MAPTRPPRASQHPIRRRRRSGAVLQEACAADPA